VSLDWFILGGRFSILKANRVQALSSGNSTDATPVLNGAKNVAQNACVAISQFVACGEG
jgi:hypothetical protein